MENPFDIIDFSNYEGIHILDLKKVLNYFNDITDKNKSSQYKKWNSKKFEYIYLNCDNLKDNLKKSQKYNEFKKEYNKLFILSKEKFTNYFLDHFEKNYIDIFLMNYINIITKKDFIQLTKVSPCLKFPSTNNLKKDYILTIDTQTWFVLINGIYCFNINYDYKINLNKNEITLHYLFSIFNNEYNLLPYKFNIIEKAGELFVEKKDI